MAAILLMTNLQIYAILSSRELIMMKEMNNSKINRLLTLWRIICYSVILGFFVFSMMIGGSAFLGYQENGRYFVRDHADIVEVSQLIWHISHAWGFLFLIFVLLTPIGEFLISKVNKKFKG